MSKSIDLDKAGECLRNIVDNNRCGFCDKFGSTYWRCMHGHIACEGCTANEEGCLICFTTFNSPVLNNTWVIDKSQLDRSKNALELLNTFQDTFKIDVFKRQRISDQLKTEKELFPDCIQAPVKYSNKKKKSYSSYYNKENSQQSYYPGENISPVQTSKMEKSKIVLQWLDSNTKTPPRKPFTNMNVNTQRVHEKYVKNKPSYKSTIVKKKAIHNITKRSKKISSASSANKSSLQNYLGVFKNNEKTNSKSTKQDDSGIGMDEECIIIEDTHTDIIDKDELALQAVHEAEKNEPFENTSMCDTTQHENVKVPYFKKNLLYPSCPNCNTDSQNHDSIEVQNRNDISIIIEYNSMDNANNKESISVQTEICDINFRNTVASTNTVLKHNEPDDQLLYQDTMHLLHNNQTSQDPFMEDVYSQNTLKQNVLGLMSKETSNINTSKNKNVVIDESDSDVETKHFHVAAEVHRACVPQDYDVLSELVRAETLNRKIRAKRGATPGSTDSSEKENFDPNRVKRSKIIKKSKKKCT